MALIRKKRREHWTRFLGEATGDEVWTVIRYTKPRRALFLPALIRDDGTTAEGSHEKAEALARTSFLGEQSYTEGLRGEDSDDDGRVEDEMRSPRDPVMDNLEESDGFTDRAIRTQKARKAAGIGGLGAPVLRLLWKLDRERVHRLVVECIRSGVH